MWFGVLDRAHGISPNSAEKIVRIMVELPNIYVTLLLSITGKVLLGAVPDGFTF